MIEILKSFVFQIIISLIFSVSFISLFVKKANNTIDSMHVGIKRIYSRGTNIKSLLKSLLSIREFYLLAYAGDGFIQSNRETLSKAFENGAHLFILIGKKKSDYLKDVSKIEKLGEYHIDHKIDNVIDEFKAMKSKFPNVRGKIEVRKYNTELRNPMIICKDDKAMKAWLTIFLPPKRAADCMMIEFHNKDKVADCKSYFDAIWNLHGAEEDVLYKSF